MISFSYHHFDEIHSTNRWLREHAAELREGAVCQADRQKAGKGRAGNKWLSATGNLYCSLLLKPKDLKLQKTGLLSFIASLAIVNTIKAFQPGLEDKLALKWPNDVLLSGRKISGILLEAETNGPHQHNLDYVIVGMGINLNHCPDLETATALIDHCPELEQIDIQDFLKKLMAHFHDLYEGFVAKGFDAYRDLWMERAFQKGQIIRIRRSDDDIFHARFIDLGLDGGLIVEHDNGAREIIHSAEIFF